MQRWKVWYSEQMEKLENYTSTNKVESMEQGEDLLTELAVDAGLDRALIPKEGTAAHSRLWNTCKEYSKEVHLEMIGRELDPHESQSRRRQLHNELCVMIFGLDHAAVSKKDYKNITRIANLAHLVSHRDQYIKEV